MASEPSGCGRSPKASTKAGRDSKRGEVGRIKYPTLNSQEREFRMGHPGKNASLEWATLGPAGGSSIG
jgi:hypothetical protein